MAKITFDWTNKTMTVVDWTETINVESELYSEWKRWSIDDNNTKFEQAFRTFGWDETVPWQLAPKYFFLTNGWRIIVDDDNVVVASNLYTDEWNSPFILKNWAAVSLSNSDVPVIDQKAIQYASYNWWVTLDITSDNVWTTYPVGNTEFPVNNMTDAMQICNNRWFDTINIVWDIHLTDENVSGKKLIWQWAINSTFTIDDDVNCNKIIIKNAEIRWILDWDSIIDNCVINDLTYFNWEIINCKLRWKVVCEWAKPISFTDCKMADIWIKPIIDAWWDGQNVSITGWEWMIILDNLTWADNQIWIWMKAGHAIILDTCTAWQIYLSWAWTIEDNSWDWCEIINSMIDWWKVSQTRDLIEFLRPHHTWTWKVIFWNPYNWNDNFSWYSTVNAVKTFAKAHDLADNNWHDIITIVPWNPSWITEITEQINITKNYLFIRWPWRDVLFNYSSDLEYDYWINIEWNWVELSWFRITNKYDNSVSIKWTGHFSLIENVYVEQGKNWIHFTDSNNIILNDVQILQVDWYALSINWDSSAGKITECVFSWWTWDGIIFDTSEWYGWFGIWHSAVVNNWWVWVTMSDTTQVIVIDSSNVIENNEGWNVVDNWTFNVDKSDWALSGEEHDAIANINTLSEKILKFVKLIFFIK